MGWVVKTVLPREIQKLASTIERKDTTTTLHIEHRTQLAFKSQREHIATVNVLRLGSKETDVINNSCIYDAYKELYLRKRT